MWEFRGSQLQPLCIYSKSVTPLRVFYILAVDWTYSIYSVRDSPNNTLVQKNLCIIDIILSHLTLFWYYFYCKYQFNSFFIILVLCWVANIDILTNISLLIRLVVWTIFYFSMVFIKVIILDSHTIFLKRHWYTLINCVTLILFFVSFFYFSFKES